MYEAATGQVPFQGDDAISVALKQVNEQPKPPSQLNPAVDPSLESIILKCMQKNPAERFQTADELYRTLRDYLAGRMQAVNSATAMLPAQPTNKLDRGAGTIPAAGGTASMPRVERANRYRGQSATEQAAEQEDERQRKRRRNIILGVIGGIAVLAVVIFAVTSLLGSGTTMRTVPNLITLTQDEAIEEIEAAGFVAGTPEEVYSSSYPEGQVCEQDPRAYREMPEGSTINFKVSKGEEPVEQTSVPDLTNKTEEEAQALLAEANLKGRAGEEREDANIEQGLICDQDYDPGSSVDVGTTITYYVSSGSGQEVIPNVEGDDESTARSRLESAGFVVSSQTSNSDTVAEGHVIYTTPGVGETADVGSTVTIYVSSGPAAPKEYDVQYVVGWTYAEAYAALTNQGFSPVLATGNSAEGIVSSQSVTGTAPKGAEIVLTTRTPDTGSGDGEGTDGETEGNGAQGITGLSANTGA